MKKSHGFLCGFAVIAIAAMFTLAGCEDDSTDSNNNQTGGGKALSSIYIKNGTPDKKTFFVGDQFDTTGLVLVVTYDDYSTEDVTTGFTTEPAHDTELTEASSYKTVTVSYTSGGVTETATYTIRVKEPVTQASFIGRWNSTSSGNINYFEITDELLTYYAAFEPVFSISTWGNVVTSEDRDYSIIKITGAMTTPEANWPFFAADRTEMHLRIGGYYNELNLGDDEAFTTGFTNTNGDAFYGFSKQSEEE